MEMDSVICLADCSQSVVVDGASSKPVAVLSGVPQGTVLGPLIYCCTLIILLTDYLPHFAYLLMIVSYIKTSNLHKTQYYFKRIFTYYLTGLQYGR